MGDRWINYLANERADKLRRIDTFTSGLVRFHVTTEGVQRDVTDETVAKLREDVAEIEQILIEEGCTIPDA
jgi:hypothetical protein